MANLKLDRLADLLPVYYKRLFPYQTFYRWLSYGNVEKNYFPYREFSFTLDDDIYLRYQSFNSADEFEKEIQRRCPTKIDIGAVYTFRPRDHRTIAGFEAVEKELVFDIDMTDYDDVRNCCSEASICKKCWPLMTIAIEVLDRALRDDFGFQHILWVYSGRRGIHCWVCDAIARKLNPAARSAIADYLTIVRGGENTVRKVKLPEVLHPSTERAVRIIEKYFEDLQVNNQDFLGNKDRIQKIVALIPDPGLQTVLQNEMGKYEKSAERWELLKESVQSLKKCPNVVWEIMLQLCYPRLDINVTKGLNHLLKSPFCVHPKTGCVSIPIDLRNLETFNPFNVPILSKLVDEINKYDAQLNDKILKNRVKDYKKTSLNQGIEVLKEFVKGLEATWSRKIIEKSDMKGDF